MQRGKNRRFARGRGWVSAKFSRKRERPPPIIFARISQWMPYNFVADIFSHKKLLCSSLSSTKCENAHRGLRRSREHLRRSLGGVESQPTTDLSAFQASQNVSNVGDHVCRPRPVWWVWWGPVRPLSKSLNTSRGVLDFNLGWGRESTSAMRRMSVKEVSIEEEKERVSHPQPTRKGGGLRERRELSQLGPEQSPSRRRTSVISMRHRMLLVELVSNIGNCVCRPHFAESPLKTVSRTASKLIGGAWFEILLIFARLLIWSTIGSYLLWCEEMALIHAFWNY